MTKNDFGVFEIKLPAKNGEAQIPHNSKIKVRCFHTHAHRLRSDHLVTDWC